MLGFMLTTGFLSMWISNTATTAMLIPIVDAIAQVKFKNICWNIDSKDQKKDFDIFCMMIIW